MEDKGPLKGTEPQYYSVGTWIEGGVKAAPFSCQLPVGIHRGTACLRSAP